MFFFDVWRSNFGPYSSKLTEKYCTPLKAITKLTSNFEDKYFGIGSFTSKKEEITFLLRTKSLDKIGLVSYTAECCTE